MSSITESLFREAKRIPLTQGKFVIVDAEDYPRLVQHKWRAQKTTNTYYAVRDVGPRDKQTRIWMHREIMQTPKGMVVDHINHNGLDNRKRNLRNCTVAQNAHNSRRHIKSNSQYKGVCWDKYCTPGWKAQIRYKGKTTGLGYFNSEIDAAKAYDKAAKQLFGKFANVNF